jgi:hypothetical protein
MAADPGLEARVPPADQTPHEGRRLTDAARRALEEAAARRAQRDAAESSRPSKAREINGREGPDPARYGDWENKGIARSRDRDHENISTPILVGHNVNVYNIRIGRGDRLRIPTGGADHERLSRKLWELG